MFVKRWAYLNFILVAAVLVGLVVMPAAAQEDWEPGIVPSAKAENLYALLLRLRVDEMPLPMVAAFMENMGDILPAGQVSDTVEIEAVEVAGVPCLWVSAPGADPDHVIQYNHGGGYVTGSPNGYKVFLSDLAEASGVRVLAPDYRLAPEHPYPAALEDTLAVYRWLLAEGFPPEQIAIAGDSAGGGLTLATLLSARDAGDPLPAAAVVLSPWTDLAGTGVTMETLDTADPYLRWEGQLADHAAAYIGDDDPRNPFISPLYADLQGLPPLLVMVGTHEALLSDSTRLARRARRAGVDVTLDVWEGMVHVWPLYSTMMPESAQTFEEIAAFILAHF